MLPKFRHTLLKVRGILPWYKPAEQSRQAAHDESLTSVVNAPNSRDRPLSEPIADDGALPRSSLDIELIAQQLAISDVDVFPPCPAVDNKLIEPLVPPPDVNTTTPSTALDNDQLTELLLQPPDADFTPLSYPLQQEYSQGPFIHTENAQTISTSKNCDHYKAEREDWFHTELDNEQANWEAARRIQEEFDREHIELSSQMARLRAQLQVLFECPICFEIHPEDYVANINTCQHKICRKCIKGFVISKLEERRYPIVCPICQIAKVEDPGGTKTPSPSFCSLLFFIIQCLFSGTYLYYSFSPERRSQAEHDFFAVLTSDLAALLGLTEAQYSTWTELEISQFSTILHCPK